MFRPLKYILGDRIKSYSFRKELGAQKVLTLYKEWIDPLGLEAEAISFKDGMLKVRASDSVTAQELKLLEPELKKSLKMVEKVFYRVS